MKGWLSDDISELIHEREINQKNIIKLNRSKDVNNLSQTFADFIFRGNVNSAIKLLKNNIENGNLPLNDATINFLKQKYPEPAAVSEDILFLMKYNCINDELVQKTALKIRGGLRPSRMDAEVWRRILLSNNFGDTPTDFCEAIANIIKKRCTEASHRNLEPFLGCR